jgi:hypothetical protein
VTGYEDRDVAGSTHRDTANSTATHTLRTPKPSRLWRPKCAVSSRSRWIHRENKALRQAPTDPCPWPQAGASKLQAVTVPPWSLPLAAGGRMPGGTDVATGGATGRHSRNWNGARRSATDKARVNSKSAQK